MAETAFDDNGEPIPVAPHEDHRIFGCLTCARCEEMTEWWSDQLAEQQRERKPDDKVFAFDVHFLEWLLRQDNPRLMLSCWSIAIGSGGSQGISMLQTAKHFGTTKQNVSKICREICAEFNLPPSSYMRGEDARKSARKRNWRKPQL